MDIFNIIKKDLPLYGRLFPKGACYGRIKNVVYVIDSYVPLGVNYGVPVYECWIWQWQRDRWECHLTCEYPELDAVAEAIASSKLNGRSVAPAVPKNYKPHEKKLDPWGDSVFKCRRGTAITPNRWTNYLVTDKPRACVKHTNWRA